ncbi:MAG: hypothetical protein LBK60_01200 [Verrucomicrobiales bacterium]|jgi:hypothetical protein|nr:hypothetical protein [Verrucomicrobiales bacterium]
MQLKKLLSLSAVFAAVVAVSACSHPPYGSKDGALAPAAGAAQVVYLDKDLRRVLVADQLVETRNAAGLLETQVALRNATNDETLTVQARVIFSDAAGVALYLSAGTDAAWHVYTLTPGQTVRHRENALTEAATSARIEVRYLAR